MADIKPDSRVLEDGSQALLDADAAVGAGDEQIEFADLNELKPGDSAAAKPAAGAAGAKPNADAGKPAAGDDEGLPPEFKGKSKADIVRMYQDAHKVIGRQGSELGELRQKADFAIKASLEALRGRKEPGQQAQQQAAQAATLPDESEFFARPYEAVSKAIEAKLADSPIIKEIRETLGRAAADQATSRAASATERFNRAHPDAAEILRDDEFRNWVAASPIRRTLLQRAHTAYDFDAGDEVFSTWKALKGSKQSASRAGEQSGDGQPSAADVSAAAAILAKQRQAKSEAAARAASVPTGGASGAAKSGAGAGGKKVFRRADVIQLMETDPERYERLADEIALAYAEGRVR